MRIIFYSMLCVLFSFTKIHASLTQEEIESYNNDLLASYGAQIQHSFNPNNIENIVVGCDIVEHSTHFFGGPVALGNTCLGNIARGNGISLENQMNKHTLSLCSLPPIIKAIEEDNRLNCEYHFKPCCLLNEEGLEKKFERGFLTKSYAEALHYALLEESGPCRLDHKGNIWEVDPDKTIYININDSYHHIHGDFEKISSLPFLPNIKKIIIEYVSGRSNKNFSPLIQNAYNILAPDGMFLMEVGPYKKPSSANYKAANRQDISEEMEPLFLPHFQLMHIDQTISGRGDFHDYVYAIGARKTAG